MKNMTTIEQVTAFITEMAALAQEERNKRDKWVLPSVCIAQAALETGWGTSSLMTKANAYFGIKATSSWTGKVYNASTKECYDGATYTNITACFRAYDSVAGSVADYFDLITGSSRYAKAVNEADPEKAITAIKEGGYATDPNYVSSIMSIIKQYNLTQYDVQVQGNSATTAQREYKYKLGDHVVFSTCYNASTDSTDKHISADKMVKNHGTITKIVNAKNPYLLDDGMCWVNDGDIRGYYSGTTIAYYPKYTGNSTSIVDALKSIGESATMENRTQIAKKNGISNYSGTSDQNLKLLNLFKTGKLIQ